MDRIKDVSCGTFKIPSFLLLGQYAFAAITESLDRETVIASILEIQVELRRTSFELNHLCGMDAVAQSFLSEFREGLWCPFWYAPFHSKNLFFLFHLLPYKSFNIEETGRFKCY